MPDKYASTAELTDLTGIHNRMIKAAGEAAGIQVKRGARNSILWKCPDILRVLYEPKGQHRLQALKVERAELEMANLRGSFVPRAEVDEQVTNMVLNARAHLLSIPDKAAPLVVAMTPGEAREHLTDLVHEALDELSTSNPTVGPAAPSDGKRVGRRGKKTKRRK